MNAEFLIANVYYSLRPMGEGDGEFLQRLYASTRTNEMALVNWSDEQKDAFLRMQFQAQTTHYRAYYPHAEYYVIQRDQSTPIGRLIIDRASDSILIVDIALLPEYRNIGIGTAILQDLMTEATHANLPIILRVEFFNPAIKLYRQLGFIKTRELDIYHEMVWQPGSSYS